MTLLVWRVGAPCDAFLNEYMRGQFPKGIDPLMSPSLLLNASLVNGLEMANATSTVAALALGDGTAEGNLVSS